MSEMTPQVPYGGTGGLGALARRIQQRLVAFWAGIPPTARPWALASLGVGGAGLVLFLVGLVLILQAARPTPPPAPPSPAAASVPVRLRIKGEALAVRALAARADGWPVPPGRFGIIYWMEGTFINLVFGLPDHPEARRLIEGLREGDPLEVEMSTGQALRFEVTGKQQVSPEETALLAQRRPGLTLLLVGGAARWAVIAAPVPEAAPPALPGGRVPIGVPVRVGPVRVTVIGVAPRSGRPDIPADFIGVQVRFEVVHEGSEPLAVEGFEMSLLDETGRRYQPTPLEGAPLPSGRLLPGGTLEGSVGYLIPTAAASGIFLWRFNPQPGRLAPAEVEFELPRPTPTSPPQAHWRIQVDEARWLPEEGVLEIRGGFGNTGDLSARLGAEAVVLQAAGGRPVPLLEADPPLPWTVAPGQTLAWRLRYALAQPGPLTLQIGPERFEIQP